MLPRYTLSHVQICALKTGYILKIIKYEGLISSIRRSRLVSDGHQNKWSKCKEGAPQTVGLADTLYSREWLTEAPLQPPEGGILSYSSPFLSDPCPS